jgi:hypothetical protein
MKLKDTSKHAAFPSQVFTTLLILLIALVIVQTLAHEIIRMHPHFDTSRTPSWEETLSQEDRGLLTIARSAKVFLLDGTLHTIRVPERTPGVSREQIFDANNNLLWEGPSKDRPYDYLFCSYAYNYDVFYWGAGRWYALSPDSSRPLEIPVKQQNEVHQIWRYLQEKAVFVGHDKSGKRIGYMGSAGLGASPAEAGVLGNLRAFAAHCPPDSYSPTLLWQTEQFVYQINFEQQKIDVLMDCRQSHLERMKIHNWGPHRATVNLPGQSGAQMDEEEIRNYRPLLYCQSEDGNFHLLMQQPDQTVTAKIPQEWRKWYHPHHPQYGFAAIRDGIYMTRTWVEYPDAPDRIVRYNDEWWGEYHAEARKHHIELYTVDETGSLDLVNRFDWTVPSRKPHDRSSRAQKLAEQLTAISPPLYRLLAGGFTDPLARLASQTRSVILSVFAQGITELAPRNFLLSLALSATGTVIVLLHAWPRRTSNAEAVFWLTFTLLFSLAGLLTYLALNYTPTVKCTSCGKRRGLAQPECPHCNAPLPRPEPRELDLILTS